MTIEQRLTRLSRALEIHPSVFNVDVPLLSGKVPPDNWDEFVDALFSVLEALAEEDIEGRPLTRDLSNFRKVAFSSGLPSFLEQDMRIIFKIDGSKKVICAIGERDPHHYQRDVYTWLTQRLRNM